MFSNIRFAEKREKAKKKYFECYSDNILYLLTYMYVYLQYKNLKDNAFGLLFEHKVHLKVSAK